ncbi:TetR/AcrR family transcriptional regulator [Pseudonocardia alni]|uniref:TetR/AcrR family transcriptional regulator n=1 Tax=Pseudonocardia alni TaxID=33907 RepID=UPI00280B6FF5|nr:TetR/AcrR family transcriptional regulator [Pseudonocardia alni]
MSPARTARGRWVEAGLQALASGGPDAVRVEALARTLGVTKGGFYGYFADRDALLSAMLDRWEQESVDDVLTQTQVQDGDRQERATHAARLTFSPRLLPIDLAVRTWAQQDESVADRLRRVDSRRMEMLRELIGTVCRDPLEAEARSLLAFCAALGARFLAARHGSWSRDEVLERAAQLLLNPGPP